MGSMPPDGLEDSTFAMPARRPNTAASEAFSGIEDERLFAELRSRIFARDPSMRVGRYRMVKRLGAGAMGEVLQAIDEELDRFVAVKFVHAHLTSERFTAGLHKEARALARLAHDNVVRVYEVGTHEGRVYLAMEYIEGGSLREWVHDSRPTWNQIVAAYLDAARGLAAAHDAGLVHRDFKPDNVLRGIDGRVAVADFGLAALDLDVSTLPSARETTPSGHIPVDFSRSGEIKGTPAYMPPEQFRGLSDARSDQFALCVSLYEGLWGERPFPRRKIDELLGPKVDWKPQPPASRGQAPSWLWPILRRGLNEDPAARWPSLSEFIAALEHGLGKRRRQTRVLGSLGATLTVGLLSGLAVTHWTQPAAVDSCSALADELEQTWTSARRETLERVFSRAAAASGQAWLEDSGEVVLEGLDSWRATWLESRSALCLARAGGDPTLLDRQAACLESQRRTAAATVDLFLEAKPQTLRVAPLALINLADPSDCARKAHQGGPPPPPPRLEARSESLKTELSQVEAELGAALYQTGLRHVEQLVADFAGFSYEPALAELTHWHGRALLAIDARERAFEELEHGADLAERSHHDQLVASSWEFMAMHASSRRQELESGRRWLRRANAAAQRVGLDPLGQAKLDLIAGKLAMHGEQPDASLPLLEHALATFTEHEELLYSSYAASSLSLAQLDAGQFALSLRSMQRSLELSERLFGPRHPKVALAAYGFGQLALGRDQNDIAVPMLQRAVEIWTTSSAERPQDLGRAHMILAQFELDAGEFQAGLDHAREAVALFEGVLPANDIRHAEVAVLVATAHYFLGQGQASALAWRVAVEGYVAAHGPDDVYAAWFRIGLGWALLAAHDHEGARAAFETGLAAIEAALGRGTEDSADARIGLVALELALGSPENAQRRLDHFGAAPTGDMDQLSFALFEGLTAKRGRPGAPQAKAKAALHRAAQLAKTVDGGAAIVEVLLDSVSASPSERAPFSP